MEKAFVQENRMEAKKITQPIDTNARKHTGIIFTEGGSVQPDPPLTL